MSSLTKKLIHHENETAKSKDQIAAQYGELKNELKHKLSKPKSLVLGVAGGFVLGSLFSRRGRKLLFGLWPLGSVINKHL